MPMKLLRKTCVILIVIVFAGFKSFAQGGQFGVFVDPHISWTTSDTKRLAPKGNVFGLNAGFHYDHYFAERYALASGVSISNVGGTLAVQNDDFILETREADYILSPGSTFKLKGQYVNVPIGFKFKTNEIGYSTFFAQVGLLGHVRLKGFVWEQENQLEGEVVSNKQFYFGYLSYMFGAGMQYSLGGASALQFGVNFSNGITKAFSVKQGHVSFGISSLRLGLVF